MRRENKKSNRIGLALILTAALLMAGCGQTDGAAGDAADSAIETTDLETAEQTEDAAADAEAASDAEKSKETSADGTEDASQTETESQVATAAEMAEVVDVVEEDMVPVTADKLVDGTYSVQVDSSSTMFKIASCELTVADGKMTATMTMGGTGYQYVYMGTGEQAVAAGEEDYISYVETEAGEHTFTVPVDALDAAIDCTAFSKKKEKWYDRTLVFRADSLPTDAFADGVIITASDLQLQDGEYTVNVTLEGGSGRSSVESPAKLSVVNGAASATIVWSSKNYDYMKVDGVQYDNENPDGNSTFVIPVTGFDCKLPVIGDTTAMSTPYEIEYTLQFDSDSIQKVE
ncbi:MAG: hypothetical protein IJ711_06325 [Lachnospiraceae bacterium]|nr:hypothetical protein [Lachnospiraceae bacterium]